MKHRRIDPPSDQRRFLLLQGPHGPFFGQLADVLRATGAEVRRIGFNRGDEVFWGRRQGYIAYRGALADWPAFLGGVLADQAITDIVLYGDTRPVHAVARDAARARGLTLHVFEEGYLRPYWVTYERGGSNGHSRLMEIPLSAMRRALGRKDLPQPDAPAHWGDMRQHVFYGALYHFFVFALNRAYPNFTPHRDVSVAAEFRLHLRRLLLMPFHRIERLLATSRVRRGNFPYHIALLQLEHDASFRAHSPFRSQTEFVDLCIDGFARGAPRHHHLVFKAHPLDDGRAPVRRQVFLSASRAGVGDRVHFIRGGKLGPLLDHARSAVTVNSTSAQQALWRGLPVRALGRAIFDKAEFVSSQPLDRFFAEPALPDLPAYRDYRQFLLETSQLPGGFYSSRGRSQLLRVVQDMILSSHDPYDTLLAGRAAPRQHLAVAR